MDHDSLAIQANAVSSTYRIPDLLLDPQRFEVHPHYIRLNHPEQMPAPFSPILPNQLRDIIASRQLTNRINSAEPKVLDDRLAGRSGQHTGLPHPAAYALSCSSQSLDRIRCSKNHGSHRCAEVLAEVERD